MISYLKYYSNLFNILLLIVILSLPHTLLSGCSFYLDANTRININDPFLSTYYFYWTNLLYLPIFFFTIIAFLSYTLVPNLGYFVSTLLTLFFLVYPFELWDYIVSNTVSSSFVYHSYGLNTLLTNTLNRYHPMVFYSSLFVLFGTYLLIRSCNYFYNMFLISMLFTVVQRYAWFCTILNLSGLWMGSWWALQEGTWGGWWNWDSSETFGLLASLILLSILHSPFRVNQSSLLKVKFLLMVHFFVLSFYFIQLNFELVSHNFGAKFFFFFNNNLFFLEIILLIILSIFFSIFWITLVKSQSRLFAAPTVNYPNLVSYAHFTRLIVTTLISVWILASYQPLVTYFAWNFAQINILNYEISLQYVNSLLCVIALCVFCATSTSWSILFLISPLFISNWKVVSLLLIPIKSIYLSIHIFVIYVIVVNIWVFDVVINNWTMGEDVSYWLFSDYIVEFSPLNLTLDNIAVEYSDLSVLGGDKLSNSWNLSTSTNNNLLNFFSLILSNQTACNLYALSSTYTTVYFYTELPLIPQLNILFLLFIILSLRLASFSYTIVKF